MGNVDLSDIRALTAKQIAAVRPGTWGDYELLQVIDNFESMGDRGRATAVTELILRSPEHSEMVYYDELYFDLTENARWVKDYPAALRWAFGGLAYEEQRQPGLNRVTSYSTIGEFYLRSGELDNGLALYTRLLEVNPADIWVYNSLALVLLEIEWAALALEVLDHALKLEDNDEFEDLENHLSEHRLEALEGMVGQAGRQAEVTPAVLARLRAAMQLSSGLLDDPGGYQPPIDALTNLDDDDAGSVYETIIAQRKVLAPDLIRMAFDEKLRGTPAPEHAVAILRQLAAESPVAFSELAGWLERAEGDWQRDLLSEWAGKIGGYYTDEIISMAGDIAYHLYVRTSMTNALVERAQKCPEQRELIIQAMGALLTRPEAHEAAEETFTGFLISNLTDIDAKELYPEIETAFAEDRVDPTVIHLQDVQKDFGMPVTPRPKRREDGLTLLLRCKSCGRVRPHFVQRVLIDILTQDKAAEGLEVKYDPLVMDREIVCPKCGARDQYEATPQAIGQIMRPAGGLEKLVSKLGGKGPEPEFKLNPRVDYVQSIAFDHPMHPLEALERYKKLIKANPRDVNLYFRMGALLRSIHRYPQMIEVYRQGYELGSDNPEFVLYRAMAEHDHGDRELADGLYEETIALTQEQMGEDPYLFELNQIAQRGRRAVKNKKASPWLPITFKPGTRGKEKPSWRRRKKGRRPKKKRRK